jgi:hypothetical protein
MRRYLTGLMAFALVISPAVAEANGSGEEAEKAAATASAAKPESAAKSDPAAKPETASMELQMVQLRNLLEAQAEELKAQHAALLEQQKKMAALEEQLHAARGLNGASPEAATAVTAPGARPSGIRATGSEAVNAAVAEQGAAKAEEGPASIRYKGITITPGGFVAAETVHRSHAVGGDINTPFTGIPYPGNALSKVAENNFTARQSRVSLLAESKIGDVKLTGYYEADWLGTGVTSNNRQSNSYVLRQRTIWAQAAFENGWQFTGGQMWSLATEFRKGIQNRQEAIPLTIDPQYNVGFTWERQYGFRVAKAFGSKFALAAAVEGPQATIGGRGFSLVTTTTTGTATITTSGNTFLNAQGSGGGLFNFADTSGYTINKAPDFIFKASADPGYGHYELFGVVSVFRNRTYPCGVVGTNAKDTPVPAVPTLIACPVDASVVPSSLGASNDTRTGGGFGATARIPVFSNKLDVAIQAMGGDGVGRYGSSQLADLTFRPNGTQALIRTAHALAELEFHPTKMLDIYAYYGMEYAWRAAYQGYNSIAVTKTLAIPQAPPGVTIPASTTTAFKMNQIGGYGSPFANNSGCSTENPSSSLSILPGFGGALLPSSGGTCAGDVRIIHEATIGLWHKIYQGPKGGLRWGLQYSYFAKVGWSGNNTQGVAGPGISPKATENTVWTGFRYYLP